MPVAFVFRFFFFFDLLFTAKCLDHVVTNPVTDLREVCQVFSLSLSLSCRLHGQVLVRLRTSAEALSDSTFTATNWTWCITFCCRWYASACTWFKVTCFPLILSRRVASSACTRGPVSSEAECRASLRVNVHTMHRFGRRVFLVVTVSLY